MLPSRARHQGVLGAHLCLTGLNTSILNAAFSPLATRGRFGASGKLLKQSSYGFNQNLAKSELQFNKFFFKRVTVYWGR